GIWTGSVTVTAKASGMHLSAVGAGGKTGVSNSFDTLIGPLASVDPTSLDVTWLQGGGAVSRTVTLSNGGDADLNWSVQSVYSGTPAGPPPLAALLASLNARSAEITALIPSRFDFTEGATGTNIIDGGSDMYDGGNYLGTNITTAGTNLS